MQAAAAEGPHSILTTFPAGSSVAAVGCLLFTPALAAISLHFVTRAFQRFSSNHP